VQKKLTTAGNTDDCVADATGSSDTAGSSHTDIFCEKCHDWFDEPHVLPNGTDVAWPSSWSREQAQAWRASQGLTRPSTLPAASPHDKVELANDTSTAGTGMLPNAGTASDQDMAPGG
jgi:hypothetical protein